MLYSVPYLQNTRVLFISIVVVVCLFVLIETETLSLLLSRRLLHQYHY